MSDVIKHRHPAQGKGDRARPSSVSRAEQEQNYCRIFGHQFVRGHCRSCRIGVEEWFRSVEARSQRPDSNR